MKILALYTKATLPILRRVQAPFSVLATRGHSFAFMQVPTFDAGLGSGYDVTVLPNWILNDEENKVLAEASLHTLFSYDLSDPALLQIPSVRRTMASCKLITVPNEYMRKEVDIAVHGVKCVVLASTVDIPYLMTANSYPQPIRGMIGCSGPYDWHMIREPLTQLKADYPSLIVLGDANAYEVLGTLVTPVNVDTVSYPAFLRQCQFGLNPIERKRGQDTIDQHEYGLLCKPMLHEQNGASSPRWVESICRMMSPEVRIPLGQQAHERAKGWSAIGVADTYLKVYKEVVRKMLPIYTRA